MSEDQHLLNKALSDIGDIRQTLGANTAILHRIENWMVRHDERDDERFNKLDADVNKIKNKMIFGSGFVAAITSVFTLWIKGH